MAKDPVDTPQAPKSDSTQEKPQEKLQTDQKDTEKGQSLIDKIKSNLSSQLVIAIIGVIGVVAIGAFYLWFVTAPEPVVDTQTTAQKAILVLESPTNEQAVLGSGIEVRGKTNAQSIVVATSEAYEETYESDEAGNFSGTFPIDEGPNEITFTAFGNNEIENSQTISVVYVREQDL